VEVPFLGDTVAICVRLREVVADIEKYDRNVRNYLAQMIEHDHAFGLQAAGDANLLALNGVQTCIAHIRFWKLTGKSRHGGR
jgi:hypothetical protein